MPGLTCMAEKRSLITALAALLVAAGVAVLFMFTASLPPSEAARNASSFVIAASAPPRGELRSHEVDGIPLFVYRPTAETWADLHRRHPGGSAALTAESRSFAFSCMGMSICKLRVAVVRERALSHVGIGASQSPGGVRWLARHRWFRNEPLPTKRNADDRKGPSADTHSQNASQHQTFSGARIATNVV